MIKFLSFMSDITFSGFCNNFKTQIFNETQKSSRRSQSD